MKKKNLSYIRFILLMVAFVYGGIVALLGTFPGSSFAGLIYAGLIYFGGIELLKFFGVKL